MDIPLPLPIVSVRDVLPTLGFTPVWGTATDLEPAYEFKGGGIDICVAQVTSLYLRPEFMIGGTAFNTRSLKRVEQSMPLALESRDQVVAWLAFAVGADFRLCASVPWFEEGRELQPLLPWERRRLELRAEMRCADAGRTRPFAPWESWHRSTVFGRIVQGSLPADQGLPDSCREPAAAVGASARSAVPYTARVASACAAWSLRRCP